MQWTFLWTCKSWCNTFAHMIMCRIAYVLLDSMVLTDSDKQTWKWWTEKSKMWSITWKSICNNMENRQLFNLLTSTMATSSSPATLQSKTQLWIQIWPRNPNVGVMKWQSKTLGCINTSAGFVPYWSSRKNISFELSQAALVKGNPNWDTDFDTTQVHSPSS